MRHSSFLIISWWQRRKDRSTHSSFRPRAPSSPFKPLHGWHSCAHGTDCAIATVDVRSCVFFCGRPIYTFGHSHQVHLCCYLWLMEPKRLHTRERHNFNASDVNVRHWLKDRNIDSGVQHAKSPWTLPMYAMLMKLTTNARPHVVLR